METEMLSNINPLLQYGAIGIVLVYFIVKDYKASKWQSEFKQALDKFNETLIRLETKVLNNE